MSEVIRVTTNNQQLHGMLPFRMGLHPYFVHLVLLRGSRWKPYVAGEHAFSYSLAFHESTNDVKERLSSFGAMLHRNG